MSLIWGEERRKPVDLSAYDVPKHLRQYAPGYEPKPLLWPVLFGIVAALLVGPGLLWWAEKIANWIATN